MLDDNIITALKWRNNYVIITYRVSCGTIPKGLVHTEYQDSKVHGANMGPTWVLSALGGPHVVPMNLAIRVANIIEVQQFIVFQSARMGKGDYIDHRRDHS